MKLLTKKPKKTIQKSWGCLLLRVSSIMKNIGLCRFERIKMSHEWTMCCLDFRASVRRPQTWDSGYSPVSACNESALTDIAIMRPRESGCRSAAVLLNSKAAEMRHSYPPWHHLRTETQRTGEDWRCSRCQRFMLWPFHRIYDHYLSSPAAVFPQETTRNMRRTHAVSIQFHYKCFCRELAMDSDWLSSGLNKLQVNTVTMMYGSPEGR